MTLHNLIDELTRIGASVTVDGDALRIQAAHGAIYPELRDTIQAKKPELLAWARRRQAMSATIAGLEISARELWDSLTAAERAEVDAGTLPPDDLRLFARLLLQGRYRLSGYCPPHLHISGPCGECRPRWIVTPASQALAGCALCANATATAGAAR